jgi:hypothetical protein
MRQFARFVCLACAVSLGTAVDAQDPVDPALEAELAAIEASIIGDAYEVTLDVDAATWEDDDLMEASLAALPDGEAPRSVRKLVAGVVAEMRLALGKRISNDVITLDDGTTAIASLKKKKAKKKKTGGASVIFDGSGQPDFIVVRSGNCIRFLDFPSDGNGAPVISGKCAIKK